MEYNNIYIAEAFYKIKEQDKIIEKRLGFKAFAYSKTFNSYVSLSTREEYVLEGNTKRIGTKYVKASSIIPYSSFGIPNATPEEARICIKKKIIELKKEYEDSLKDKNEKNVLTELKKELTWDDYFNLITAYYNFYGDLQIPYKLKTSNGIDPDPNGVYLRKWLEEQRRAYNKESSSRITIKQANVLKRLGYTFEKDDRETRWMEKYNLAASYYECYGNLEVPSDFITKNGIDYDPEGVKLGGWIGAQRQYYKNKNTNALNEKQIELLNNIGMRFTKHEKEDIWTAMYNLLKEYKEHFGNIDVPADFITLNGYEYNFSGLALGRWLQVQKRSYVNLNSAPLTIDKIKLLEDLNIVWYDDEHDANFQSELITRKKLIKKRRELTNRLYSILNKYNQDELPDIKIINEEYVRMLNKRGK